MQQDTLIGRQLGAYQIQSKLGEGGMARVYKAYHARLRRDVAIKVILSQVANDGDFQARFEREAQLIASLEHPNIVAVFDFGEIEALTYLVMQYVGGGTLRDQMHGGQAMEPRRAAHYMAQMARALHHAHQRGVVHRDVKPQNMLVSSSDRDHLLLSDFGIAKLFDGSAEVTRRYTPGMQPAAMSHDPSLTSADQIIGTAQYMAPEQVKREAVDARTDVYALGVVLFQLLTGQLPFEATTTAALMYQHIYTAPKTARLVNPYVPELLGNIAAKALEKAPAARFQTAEEMARALEAFASASSASSSFTSPATNPFATSPYGAPTNQTAPRSPSTSLPGPSAPLTPTPAHYANSSPAYVQPIAYQTPAPVTELSRQRASLSNPTITGPATPLPARRRSTNITRTLISLVVIALVIGVAVFKLLPSASSGGGGPRATTKTQPFTDTFANNTNSWPNGDNSGLSSNLDTANNHYQLNVSDTNTHFPTPANVGTLPKDYTLTVDLQQSKAPDSGASALYGLAFGMTYNGDAMQSGYTFVIYGNSQCTFFRYDPGQTGSPFYKSFQTDAIATSITSHKIEELSVTVRGSNFTFRLNGTVVATYSDSTYSGGHLGLVVAGFNTQYIASKVALEFKV